MFTMKSCNMVVSLLGLLLGACIMHAASAFPLGMTDLGPGPGFWPFLLGAGMAVAAVVLCIYTWMDRIDLTIRKVSLNTEGTRQAYAMMGVVVLFCAAIRVLGFYPATICVVPLIMYRLECRNKLMILLTTVGVTLFIYLVFGYVLQTTMPQSVFLD